MLFVTFSKDCFQLLRANLNIK